MSDIVERLRKAPRHGLRPKSCKDCEIAGLEAENKRLRKLIFEGYHFPSSVAVRADMRAVAKEVEVNDE